MVRGEIPADGAEVLFELLLVACTDNDGRYGRTLQQPIEGNLRHTLPGLSSNFVQGIDYTIQVFIADGRPVLRRGRQATNRWHWLATTDFTGEPPPSERTPYYRANALILTQRHELPLVVTPHQGIECLIGDKARIAIAIGRRQGFHEMPA